METYEGLRSNASPDWAVPTDFSPAAAPERVSFGGAQTLETDTARAVMQLWYARARANVGTALTAAEVGPLVLELLTPQIMSMILSDWWQRNPGLFGSYLAEVLTGARPSAGRKRGPQ